MKNILKGPEPLLLNNYRTANPDNDWEHCKRSEARKKQISAQIRQEQAGLCAYCEIALMPASASTVADFRVEHFHPKSDNSTTHNWHLDWQNLLGCCHGGSRADVTGAHERFTSPDHSCDVPKGDKNLDGVILNPLQLPAFPALFSAERHTGKLAIKQKNCNAVGICTTKAQATIDELRLNAPRLNRFRQNLLNKLNMQLAQEMKAGLSLEQARKKLAKIFLSKDNNQHWPAFFTTIRGYLGSEAEIHLRSLDYKG